MSKSKGNIVNPDDIIKRYGADTLRLYELFMGPLDQAGEWSDRGVVGVFRFLNRIWNLQKKVVENASVDIEMEKRSIRRSKRLPKILTTII